MEKARWTLENKLNRNGVLPKIGDNIYLIKTFWRNRKIRFPEEHQKYNFHKRE